MAEDESNAQVAPVAKAAPAEPVPEAPVCPHCVKPDFLCVCDSIEPVSNRVSLLILQHPQEQDRLLGTARLAQRALKNAQLTIGLSWPSLSKILGRDADPAQWAVLHLGAGHSKDFPPDRELVVLDKKGAPAPDQDRALAGVRGVVIFDGSWAQAKTLWWRNPWVLKAKRLALNPKRASLYGNLRREPRREALSTIEAAGLALSRLERKPEIEAALLKDFSAMLGKYRAALASGALAPPPPPPRRGRPPRRGPSMKKSAPPSA